MQLFLFDGSTEIGDKNFRRSDTEHLVRILISYSFKYLHKSLLSSSGSVEVV